MAITKTRKQEVLKTLKDVVGSKSLIFVNFKKLGVADTDEMRKTLREDGVRYMVAKKTLVKRALADANIKGELPEMEGELALAYGDDETGAARGVYEFSKKYKDSVSIMGGVFQGAFMDKSSMTEIATIPPIGVLYGQFLNVINSPIQGLVVALGQIAEQKTQ